MKLLPLVSVFINSYNHEKYVGQAIESILQQTYKNIEIIIVDDASVDSSPQILERYKRKYPDKIVKLELLKENIGVSRAANLAISFTKGKYIHGFSSDDRMHPDKIMTQVKYLEKNNEVAVVFTQVNYIDENGNPIQLQNEIFNINYHNIRRQLLNGNFLCAPSSIFRADIFKKITLNNPAIKYVQDYELWLRILEKHEIVILPKKLTEYRIHGKNLSIFGEEYIPLAIKYEIVVCILEAINSWPLEKLLPLFLEEDALASVQGKAKAFALIALHCLNIDLQYFGRPLLATDTAYRFALKGLLIDPDSVECQQVLCRVYEAMGDRERADNGRSIDLKKWRNTFLTLNSGHLSSEQGMRVIVIESPSYTPMTTIQEPVVENNQQEDRYSAWANRHHWSQQSCQYLNEISKQWQVRPSISILIIAKEDHHKLVENTIRSLIEQTLDLWNLTIIVPTDFAQSAFTQTPQISWLKLDPAQHSVGVLANVDVDNENDWLLICEPGTCFEPVFCNLIGELIHHYPEWRFIYTDEDITDDEGRFSKPSLKPAINLDLLRSYGYTGHACLIHSDLWQHIPIAERTNPSLLLNYAAALRCQELFGEKAVGHIDQVLFHHPLEIADDLEKFEESGKLILQECLWRQGIFADINPGLIKGSFFVDYPLLRTPKVSVIIPTRDRLDLFRPCLESLLEKTLYPDYEIIVVDNHSNDPETLEYLGQLPTLDHRIKVIPYYQNFNYPAINNLAAQQAQGDFLLLLNDDTVVLQENWLQRLVAIGLREEVGVVGCRLIYPNQTIQHAGIILGLGGTVGHIGSGLTMNETGYMGRMQLVQNFSAVSAACMLVRKDIYFQVGGFDQKELADIYSDVDLCLKISEKGYKIVWTPFVNLTHHEASKWEVGSDNKPKQPDASSRKAFLKKWLPLLGNDPAYNRHLSLRQYGWMIDGDFDVPWHPELEKLPRIVAQPPDLTGVGQYRMIGPLKELEKNGRICNFLLPAINSGISFLPSPSELSRVKPDVLFLQNAFSHWHIGEFEAYLELFPDIFRVFGQDDIVFAVPPKSSVHKFFGKDTKARLRKAASLCHRVIATSEPIADAMRGMVDDIRVMPNYLERSLWGNLQPPRKERRKLRVGWAGAQQHQGDLEFIIPVVEATANEVDWIFMGMCLAKLRYHIAEVHDAMPFDQYPAGLAALDLDLAIAPLEINRFNAAKSNLRILEYGAVGYPVICTDIEPYRNAPVTRVPNNPQVWIDAIRAHIHDIDATRAAGEQLHEWVLSNWMLDQHLDEWMKMLLPD